MKVSWDHAYGAFLGVLCGDAAGATLEFCRVTITSAMARDAMHMPGGGLLKVGRGQITDDSELALALAQGLVGHAPRDGLPLDAIARKYREWWRSSPYDIGNTCSTAFGIQTVVPDMAAKMTQRSAQYNTNSEANGSLMRILPLAIWASKLPSDELVAAAKQEATLSHPHPVCQDCNAVYCLIVAHLITHPGDGQGALEKAEVFVNDNVDTVVRDWFLNESLDISVLDCSKQIGHVRWAFNLAIHFLRENTSYEQGIHDTLLKAGDTDTNAAIVGGILGALHGASAIPDFMKTPVLAFDCTRPNPGQPRPAAYRSDQVEDITRALLQIASEQSL